MKKKLFWLPMVTNFNVFVLRAFKNGNVRIKDLDSEIKFTIKGTNGTNGIRTDWSTFSIIGNDGVVTEPNIERFINSMEEKDHKVINLLLHETGEKLIVSSTI